MGTHKEVLIPGPVGKIEAVIEQPFESSKKLIGIICHPLPTQGGTMNNKVVTTVIKAFQRLDIVPVKFNFRGVGKSDGQFDGGVGELEDLFAVIKWLREHYPDYKIVLAGFSFGSYVATKAATMMDATALVTIAPPVHHYDFAGLPPINIPWIVVQGSADEVVPLEMVLQWLEKLKPKPIVIYMMGVSHFFHGHLLELREELEKNLSGL